MRATSTQPLSGAAAYDYIVASAQKYGVDPQAALAVAGHEGLSGAVGDYGTSFGPWQLHIGGAYPSSAPQEPTAANAWAWSPAGIDYAIRGMASKPGVKGATGKAAITAIVTQFERPLNPEGDLNYANAAYGKVTAAAVGDPAAAAVGGTPSIYQNQPRPSGNSGLDSALDGAQGVVTGFVENLPIVGGIIRGAKDATDAFKVVAWLFSPKHWVQVFEIIVGVGMLAAGFVWLGKGDDSLTQVNVPLVGKLKKKKDGAASGAAAAPAELAEAAPEALAAA